MNYYPLLGLGHETVVCAVCLSIFLWCQRPQPETRPLTKNQRSVHREKSVIH